MTERPLSSTEIQRQLASYRRELEDKETRLVNLKKQRIAAEQAHNTKRALEIDDQIETVERSKADIQAKIDVLLGMLPPSSSQN